jgi:hypothetical protein
MDYEQKYKKYKTKYKTIKEDNRINIENIKSKIFLINYPSEQYDYYKEKIISLYKKCEPDEKTFIPLMDNTKIIILSDVTKNNIFGFLALTSTKIIQKMFPDDFYYKGGLSSPGLFMTSLCGNNLYKGVSNPLIKKLNKFKKYDYILLHVSTKRKKVHNIYKKHGFNDNGIINIDDETFHIMRKTL